MNGNGALKRKSLIAQPSRGILVPPQYAQQPPHVSRRSVQINIDSADDAKSVIQNLGAIKQFYDDSGMDSVEFCIAKSVVKDVENTLRGAINWCTTFVKHVAPQPGNVLFALPSFKDLSIPTAPISPDSTSPVNAAPQAPVKPQRPVRAESARQ